MIEPFGVVILEGLYSTRTKLRDHYDFRIWVDCPFDIKRERALARRAHTRSVAEIESWIDSERAYIAAHQPEKFADLIVSGRRKPRLPKKRLWSVNSESITADRRMRAQFGGAGFRLWLGFLVDGSFVPQEAVTYNAAKNFYWFPFTPSNAGEHTIVGLTRFDGHPPSGVHPLEGCSHGDNTAFTTA